MNGRNRLRRITAAALSACLAAMLSGCGRRGNEEKPAAPALPPATVGTTAPDGDQAIRPKRDYKVYAYLPEVSKSYLTAIDRTVEEGTNLQATVEILIRTLLEAMNENRGATSKLEFFRGNDNDRNPEVRTPEISGGICTVNLAPSAGSLDDDELYWLGVALATTLCELDEINGVNVLVADKAVGLDDTNMRLPMGTLAGHTDNESLPVLWEHMDAKKPQLGSDGSKTAFTAEATIYYPLPDERGIGCEKQTITFSGQTPNQMAEELIKALDRTMKRRTGNENLPDLETYMENLPIVTKMDGGDQSVSIIFSDNIQELLDQWDTDKASLIAAVTGTLLTFVPRVIQASVYIGDQPETEMNNRYHSRGLIGSGIFSRADAAAFLTGSVRVFFEKDGKLTACEKPVERELADSPRAMLQALMEGPDRRDRDNGISATLPSGLKETDILNIATYEDTLLVKLSTDFLERIREYGADKEMLLCYSMVNTLCANTGMNRVCFFFGDEQAETIAGDIYWSGTFIRNPGL